MDLADALTVANGFIITRLNGDWRTITPLSAAYDEDNENWVVKCGFKRPGATKSEIVTLWIDDEEEKVISFQIE